VARSIANASPDQRGGREKATVFLCLSRVPIVEETYMAQQWFHKKKKWYDSAVQGGLWEKGNMGLQTHVIPQRAFYGFEEALVGRAEGTLAREPLAQAYDALTGQLLTWMIREIEFGSAQSDLIEAAQEDQVPYLETRIEQLLRELMVRSSKKGPQAEATAIQQALTTAAQIGHTLSNESALRQRLAEIEAQSEPAPRSKPKRRRTQKSS